MYKISVSTHTDIGDTKKTNQDSILEKTGTFNRHNVGLFIVADGCGGLQYGEEISKLITSHFSNVWDNTLGAFFSGKRVDEKGLDRFLDDMLNEVNQKAYSFGAQVGGRVGSTISLLVTYDKRYILKNIGDSRIYLKRGKKVLQLTEDQSLVADLVRNGELTKEEAKTYKKKNVLTMCIGVFEELQIFSASGKIKNKDTFILCCDGLHNHVSEKAMMLISSDKKIPFEEKAFVLRDNISTGAANDNVSAIVARFDMGNKRTLDMIVIAIVLVLLAVIFRNVIINWLHEVFCTIGCETCREMLSVPKMN